MKTKSLLFAIMALLLLNTMAFSQSEAGKMSFGFNAGAAKYWGEFTDNQFWLGGDVFLRYNILSQLSLQASVGLSQIRWKTGQDRVDEYPNYFELYDAANNNRGVNIPINPKNSTAVIHYDLTASYNFFPTETFVPYIFGGIGYMTFEPKSGDTGFGGLLPNNGDDVYENSSVNFPIGAGFETYITPEFVFNGRVTYRFTGTDYLDDFSNDDTDDELLTFGVGFSYYILGNDDYDGDGLTNKMEEKLGTDPNNPDTDGDRLNDGDEHYNYKSNPLKIDSDDDGLSDYIEVMDTKTDPIEKDTDKDGLNDGEEQTRKTQPLNPDTDDDGLIDGDEVNKHETLPTSKDTDGDGLSDGEEILKYNTNPKANDSDGDGLEDGEEVQVHKTNPAMIDTDEDGLRDGNEVNMHNTNPLKPDSDGDGLKDGEEINTYLTDPNKQDTDGDTLTDGTEVNKTNTDPTNPDTDGDGVRDDKDDCPLIKGKPSTEEGKNGCPQAPKIGTKLDFPAIYFIVDSDEFNYKMPETIQNLTKLLAYVRQCDGLAIMIEGHASSEGADDYNQKLSERRAKKVREWLIEQGVEASKISGFIGYGESRPKVQEPTGAALKSISKAELEEIRKQNRRITVEVTRTCDQGK
jgi:outer membrane protein OmpA-like peptidoglycan-associated protein